MTPLKLLGLVPRWVLYAAIAGLVGSYLWLGSQHRAVKDRLLDATTQLADIHRASASAALRQVEREIEQSSREAKALKEYHDELETVRGMLYGLPDSGGLRPAIETFVRGGAADAAQASPGAAQERAATLGGLLAEGDELLAEGRELARALSQSAEQHASEVRLFQKTCPAE